MERAHEGSPMIVVCPPVRMRMSSIDLLGECHSRQIDSMRFAEESPLYFVFLESERKVEVLTEIGTEMVKTREPKQVELDRLREAYAAGKCYYQDGDTKIPIRPKRK